jgi:hypothetical protein
MHEAPPDPKEVQAALGGAIATAGTLFPEVAKADPSDNAGFNTASISAFGPRSGGTP